MAWYALSGSLLNLISWYSVQQATHEYHKNNERLRQERQHEQSEGLSPYEP